MSLLFFCCKVRFKLLPNCIYMLKCDVSTVCRMTKDQEARFEKRVMSYPYPNEMQAEREMMEIAEKKSLETRRIDPLSKQKTDRALSVSFLFT